MGGFACLVVQMRAWVRACVCVCDYLCVCVFVLIKEINLQIDKDKNPPHFIYFYLEVVQNSIVSCQALFVSKFIFRDVIPKTGTKMNIDNINPGGYQQQQQKRKKNLKITSKDRKRAL